TTTILYTRYKRGAIVVNSDEQPPAEVIATARRRNDPSRCANDASFDAYRAKARRIWSADRRTTMQRYSLRKRRQPVAKQLGALHIAPPIAIAAAMLHASPALAVDCGDLMGRSLPDGTITLAQSYTAGQNISGPTNAPVDLCRVG